MSSDSASIGSCEKGKQWEGALGLLQEMVHQLLTPDVVSFNAAISAFEKGKQCKEALRLLQEPGVMPGQCSYQCM